MEQLSTFEIKFPHLYLVDWPFRVVPDERLAMAWAGRKETRRQIERIALRLSRRRPSSVHLMWADFGAGKTHTLFFMRGMCSSLNMLPMYVEWPKTTKTFVDVYRAIMQAMTLELLTTMFKRACEHNGIDTVLGRAGKLHREFEEVLLALYKGDHSSIVMRWLRGDTGMLRSNLSLIGVSHAIKTSDDAVRSLAALVDLVAQSSVYNRLLLMLDEFQRVDRLKPRIRQDVNDGLHTLINACPECLSIILSFSFGRPDNIQFLLTPELYSRADLETITLPVFRPHEAKEFVMDLLDIFRASGAPDSCFPFTEASIGVILSRINKLTPREIMKYFDFVLREADLGIEDGSIDVVTPDYVQEVLKGVTLRDEEPE